MTAHQCSADRAGIGGCQARPEWTVKAADVILYACGRHLNRVCLKMRLTGAEYMTVSAREAG